MKLAALKLFDGADLYLNIIYLGLFIIGIDLLLVGTGETTIDNNLPYWVYIVWVLLHIAAPLSSWAGQFINYRRQHGARGRMAFAWELRWAADSVVFFIVVTAVISLTATHSPDLKRTLVLYILCGVWTLMHCLRDVLHIVYRERCVHHDD